MSDLMNFDGNAVEVFEFEGRALFNPYHVGDCLELTDSAVRMAMKKMSGKQVIKLTNSIVKDIDFRKLHNTGENFLTESGVYKLVFKSNKPDAERFQDWVTDEVLPTIRKHGAYMTEATIEKTLTDPDFIIGLATELKKERQRAKELELTTKKQEQIIGELKPSADYTDRILKNRGLVTITQIAKDYGMSGTAMNKLLNELKIQYKQSDQWLLYRDHSGKGYTHSETIDITRSDGRPDISMITKWTQKGRLFLYEVLKAEGYVPTIERN